MTQILRVVWTKNKLGLYEGRGTLGRTQPHLPDRWLAHPCPYRDTLLKSQWDALGCGNQSKYSFGFLDEKQFKDWVNFEDTRKEFNDWLQIQVWDVRKTLKIGTHQVVFRKGYATHADTLDLVSFD